MTHAHPRAENRCGECESRYFADSSKMAKLCPECAHALYGYLNCPHEMAATEAGDSRCNKCGWDGSVSTYLRSRR